MARHSMFLSLVPFAIASLVVACGGEAEGEANGVSVEASEPSFKLAGGGGNGVSNLTDHGGPVLTSSNTYAIYWGTQSDFPSDLRAGMASLLGGMNGSSPTPVHIPGQYTY